MAIGKKKSFAGYFEKLKMTGEDLTTLEINTIIKDQMSATSPPANNRIALYELAGQYAEGIERLGRKYEECLSRNDHSDVLRGGTNLFRHEKLFEGGGVFSFRELSLWANYAIKWLQQTSETYQFPSKMVDDDISILARIEVKCLEISRILEETLHLNEELTNPLKVALSKEEQSQVDEIEDGNEIPPKLQTLDQLYKVLQGKGSISYPEKKGEFLNDLSDIPLDFKHKMIVHKAIDLGIEFIVMQTRISIDGDITTRIASKFAASPVQFVLDMHNSSIELSVNYWSKIFDALVDFVTKIVSRIRPGEK